MNSLPDLGWTKPKQSPMKLKDVTESWDGDEILVPADMLIDLLRERNLLRAALALSCEDAAESEALLMSKFGSYAGVGQLN